MNKLFLIGIVLLLFSLLFGCTGSDTFIIQNTKLNKLFDGNVSGDAGLIPFLNFDGNKLEVSSGFDFNSDTNTLSTNCLELGDGNTYCSSTDFPNPDLSNLVPYTNAVKNVDLNDFNIDASNVGAYVHNFYEKEYTVVITGGEVTTDGDYMIHTFKSSGTFFSNIDLDINVLVVAGGGGGGAGYWGGGGGAGGLIYREDYSLSQGTYSVTIGAGGAVKVNGQNSIFNDLTAIGGGHGSGQTIGDPVLLAGNGGSGGGAGWPDEGKTFGYGTVGQGHNGGLGVSQVGAGKGGGGGGAGEAGHDATSSYAGDGGDGLYFEQFEDVGGYPAGWFAGGAGAIRQNSGKYGGIGGKGGGGSGRTGYSSLGVANTGGGGLSTGGSGIVIIRYKIPNGGGAVIVHSKNIILEDLFFKPNSSFWFLNNEGIILGSNKNSIIKYDGAKLVVDSGNDLVDFTGDVKASNFVSSLDSYGITDNSFYLCINSSCSSTCQVAIENGLITGCN